jgi:hypothetical protein
VEHDLEALRARARALPVALDLPVSGQAATEASRLSGRLDEVFDHADYEPSSPAKTALLGGLEAAVRRVPARWAAMHGALRTAAGLARRRPKLAEYVGVNRLQALDGRVRAALSFIELEAELESAAGSWPRDAARLVPDSDVEQLLASPDDPAIEWARREGCELTRWLEKGEDIPPAPLHPAAPSLAAFQQWWRDLELLFSTLARLRESKADLDRKLRWACEDLAPRAQSFLDRQAALPKELWRPELKELEDAMREVVEKDGDVSWKAYSRFMAAFRQAEGPYGRR